MTAGDPRTTVALYSGGVDSYCMAYLTQPDVLLNVNMGGRYGNAEYENLQKAYLKSTVANGGLCNRALGELKLIDMPLGQWEEPESKVIPGRNAMLAILASQYGDRIFMGSVDSSTGSDKDPVFAGHMNRLFAHMYAPQRWLPQGRHVTLELPVYQYTKTQLVGMVLAAGHDPDALAALTFSCYEPEKIHMYDDFASWTEWRACGKCPPCGRKWMAFTVYGVDVGFDGHGAVAHYRQEITDGRAQAVGRSQQFIEDLLDAWDGRRRELPLVPAELS